MIHVFEAPVPQPQQFKLIAASDAREVWMYCQCSEMFNLTGKSLDEAVAMADQHEQEKHAYLPAVSA